MKWVGEGSEVTYISLDDYINASDVYKVLDRGAVIAITPYAKRVEQVRSLVLMTSYYIFCVIESTLYYDNVRNVLGIRA